MKTLNPLNKKVLVLPEPAKDRTEGGLYIPEQGQERPVRGTVIAVAKDCDFLTTHQLQKTVLYGKFAGTEIELEVDENENDMPISKKFLLINEKEILGIVD